MLMLVMVMVVMVTAAHGDGAARMRNCIVSQFWEERSNELKFVISAGTHKFKFIINVAIIKDQKSALEMAWRPNYKKVINRKVNQ